MKIVSLLAVLMCVALSACDTAETPASHVTPSSSLSLSAYDTAGTPASHVTSSSSPSLTVQQWTLQQYTEQMDVAFTCISDAVGALTRAIDASKARPSDAAEAEVLGAMEDSLRALRAARDVLMDGSPPTSSLSRLHVDLLGRVIDALESGGLAILNTRRLYEQSSVSQSDRAQSGRLATRWAADMNGVLRVTKAWLVEWGRQLDKAGLPSPDWLTE